MPRWLKQLASYIISFVVYAWLLNPVAAAVLLGAIAFHECGHLYAAKYMGLRTKGFYLIPFMGGTALVADRYQKYSHMAFVLLAGPIAGTLLAIPFFALYVHTGSIMLGASALLMAGINLFNLAPLAMLDGGQLIESITYSINDKLAATFLTISYIVGAIVVWSFNPFISAMIIFFGVGTITSAWKKISLKNEGLEKFLPPQPEKMSVGQIIITGITYLFTAVILCGMLYFCVKHNVHIKDLLSVKLPKIL